MKSLFTHRFSYFDIGVLILSVHLAEIGVLWAFVTLFIGLSLSVIGEVHYDV